MSTSQFKNEQMYAHKDGEDFTGPVTTTDKIEIFTDQGGGWRDMLGQITPPSLGPTIPTWTILTAGSPFYAWKFAVNDQVWLCYHIQHDYKPAGDVLLHAHWMTDGTSTAAVKWEFTWSYAKGFNQGAASTFNTTGTVVTVEEAASGTAFRHMTSEIAASFATADFEVDGLIEVRLRRVTNGGVDNANSVFLLMADAHYKSNTFNTKNRAPNFYT